MTRVTFDGRRATGVEHSGGAHIKARLEVVLAAGTIGSPYLLMRSGVGAADELRDAGVPVVHELPEVGKNLQDHLSTGVFVECLQPVTLTKAESIPNLLRYIVLRSGMLTTNVGEAVAFIRTSEAEPAPDVELVFAPVPFKDHGLTPPTGHGLTVGVVLLQPESRGRIGLNGRDVVIDPAYLSAEADVRRLVAGLKRAKEVFATAAMKPYAGGPMAPYWGAGDRRGAGPVGTRARRDPLSPGRHLPDGRRRRLGGGPGAARARRGGAAGGGRVDHADAQQGPHPRPPAIMIGEKAADLIRGAQGLT
ncbi:hypothetical protein GCM10020001_019530 [Nonomuraea salmonea]